MIIPLTTESSTSEQLNDFFDSDLTFTQTSLNKNKNLIEESEGIFKRLEDNSIVIEISTPFRENYFIDKNKIKKGNLILAIPSSGIHSNGYSLLRYILKKNKINFKKNNFLKRELIKPTKIYTKEILLLNEKNLLNGCANITGGGIIDNIKRVIPNGLCASIDLSRIKVPRIFKWIKKQNVEEMEMLKTFNCGVGFCLIIEKKNLNKIKKFFSKEYKPYQIGKITKGKIKTLFYDKVIW